MREQDTEVRFLYRSMTELDDLPSNSTDMVFMGQSIEHITEDEGDTVFREVFRILRAGGYFCLDTPNAALTRIESPDALIHPEHKLEYTVPQLRDKLSRWNFHIVEEKGLCAMPQSLQSGQFDPREIVLNRGINDDAGSSYLFYLKAVKAGGG
jgi:predicted SAM-dependent methyltransferase